MTERRRDFLVLALLNACWAPVNFVLRSLTGAGMSPAAIAIVRWSVLAALLFGALATPGFRRLTHARWPSRGDAIQGLLIGLLLFGPSHLVYYLAISRTSSIEGTVLGTTAPIWTALLAFLLLGEAANGRRLAAIGLGLAGAWIVGVGLRLPALSAGHTVGNLMYLAGVAMEAVAGVLAVRLVRRSSGITVLAFEVLGAVPALLLLGSAFPLTFATGAVPLMGLAYLTLVPGLLCFGVWYRMVERVPLSLMILTLMLQPPLSALLGWRLLGEPITAELVAGTVLILGALMIGATDGSATK